MLHVLSPLKGFSIEASDGRIGTVVDFLFDDAYWNVRWLVIDCGTWLSGRRVLIHPSAILREDLEEGSFDVALTKAQVVGSPELAEDQPVSQQMETQLYSYYGIGSSCRSLMDGVSGPWPSRWASASSCMARDTLPAPSILSRFRACRGASAARRVFQPRQARERRSRQSLRLAARQRRGQVRGAKRSAHPAKGTSKCHKTESSRSR